MRNLTIHPKEALLVNCVQEFTMNFTPRMKVNFDGEDLTSEAGWLLYKEFDQNIRFSDAVRDLLVVHDAVFHRDHPNSDVVLQKVYQHLAAYHTDDHADNLAVEPLLTALFGKDRLASQPTLSRFFEKADISTAKSLENMKQTLQRRVYEVKPQKQFVCDVDSSSFAVYGNQYEANFNAHYHQHGFHLLFCFDGLKEDCLGLATCWKCIYLPPSGALYGSHPESL